jgi:hypothetical protein
MTKYNSEKFVILMKEHYKSTGLCVRKISKQASLLPFINIHGERNLDIYLIRFLAVFKMKIIYIT